MKKILFLFLAAMILLTVPTAALAADDNNGGYIVVIKDDVEITPLFEQTYQLRQLTIKDHGVYETDAAHAARLEENALVESVYEAAARTLMVTPNDPYYTNSNQWALNAVNATAGWDITTGSSDVTVVVIDTGFDTTHPDKGNIVGGKDYITGTTTTYDHFTHGTACAGLIGAATNNGLGIAGACWNVNVVVLSVFSVNADSHDPEASDADIIAAIYDAVDIYHADVISMSLGGTSVDATMEDAVKYAYGKNVTLVAAVGNSGYKGSPLEYPAAYDEVIGVAASDKNQTISGFSTRNDSVYITAPGSNIYSLSNQAYSGRAYEANSGTSLATPYVAALAALAKTIDSDMTPAEFAYYLRITATDMGDKGYDIDSGYGLVNYEALLSAVEANKNNTFIIFHDVAYTDWYARHIYDLAWDNIVFGKEKSLYYPEDPITRAEFVTILARLAKADLSLYNTSSSFHDVADNVWYTAAINWATDKGITKGKTPTQFYPNQNVTREEITALVVRYLKLFGDTPLPETAALDFDDAAQISPFAKESTAILTALSIVNGYENNTFRPQNFATRGESAKIINLMRDQL